MPTNGSIALHRIWLLKRGEVWWVNFDPAIGSEIAKRRPAIILNNDAANRNLARVMVIPLTSKTARLYPGEALVTLTNKQSKAMADQMMAADKRSLTDKIGQVSRADMEAVEDAIRVHLGLAM